MKPDNRTAKRKLGDIGENIACSYLEKQGFKIVERNYLRKWSELDIVARKGEIIHFIEVKSVSCERLSDSVIHVTPKDAYRPEENVHPWKLKRLSRAIQTYILEKRLDQVEWQLDIVTVKIDERSRRARVEMLDNIML